MEEWQDNVRLRYNLEPLGMTEVCDGCGHRMSVEHALSCKVGGLVHIRHDDVAQELGYLCGLAYKKSRVTYKPLINHSTRGEATILMLGMHRGLVPILPATLERRMERRGRS
jgi:hypothetical protein